jgi:hypothetical protein
MPQGVELPSLAVSDALRTTFSLYRRHFLTFVLVMGILALPIVLIGQIAELWTIDGPQRPPRDTTPGTFGMYVLQSIGTWAVNMEITELVPDLLTTLASGATMVVASQVLLGRNADVAAAYRRTLGRLGILFLADLIIGMAIVLVIVTCVGFLALPYLLPGLQFIGVSILLERRGPLAAIRRSWQLVKGHRKRILLSLLTVLLPPWLLFSGVYYPLHWWTAVGYDSPLRAVGGLFAADPITQFVWAADLVILALVVTFLWPLHSIMTTVLYLDLRARERPYQLPIRMHSTPSPEE